MARDLEDATEGHWQVAFGLVWVFVWLGRGGFVGVFACLFVSSSCLCI